jgi:hypothetical protein
MKIQKIIQYLILVLISVSCCFHSKQTVIKEVHELLEQDWCNTANPDKKIVFKNGNCKEYFKDSLTNEYSYTIKIGNKEELGYHYAHWYIVFKSIPENKEKRYVITSAIEKDVLVLSNKSGVKIVFMKDCKETEVSKVFKSDLLNL